MRLPASEVQRAFQSLLKVIGVTISQRLFDLSCPIYRLPILRLVPCLRNGVAQHRDSMVGYPTLPYHVVHDSYRFSHINGIK